MLQALNFLEYSTSKEDLEEEEGETKKNRLKEASGSDSNTLPPDYATPIEETETDLDSTARCEAKPEELKNTCECNVTNNVNNTNWNGGNGNGGNKNGGNNNRCTYKEFLTCKPRDFNGKGGAITLTPWIEKMELVMDISGCVNNQKVGYAASSLINKALTWWNTQLHARGREAALGMTWEEFKVLFVKEFCPTNEMEKLETKFWNHAMVGANHAAYTNRFHELAKLVPHLVTPDTKHIEVYIHRLAPQIHGMIRATQPATIQSAIIKAGALNDEVIRYRTLSKSSEKRKEVVESSKQGGSWTDNKRAKLGKGFVATVPTRNDYASIHPRHAKCNAHHSTSIPCLLCYNYQKPSHFARNCLPTKNVVPVNDVRMGNNQKVCYECGSPDHFHNTCPKLNRAPGQAGNRMAIEGNQNARVDGNQVREKAFNMNVVEARQDPNVVTSIFSLNDHFTTILFDSGVDFSFIFTDFVSLLNVKPSILRPIYVIEIANDLIPFGHGSFDVIMGMDWLSNHKAVIVCHEKVVRIPLENGKLLVVHGE
ncbi:putative reverse transcriptase domain-containing protein [Tanacetum coccineum]